MCVELVVDEQGCCCCGGPKNKLAADDAALCFALFSIVPCFGSRRSPGSLHFISLPSASHREGYISMRALVVVLLAAVAHAQAPPPSPSPPPPSPAPPHAVIVFLLHADYACATQGANLGTSHQTPSHCAEAAMADSRCHHLGTIMFSHNYTHAWGCRCCTPTPRQSDRIGTSPGDSPPSAPARRRPRCCHRRLRHRHAMRRPASRPRSVTAARHRLDGVRDLT